MDQKIYWTFCWYSALILATIGALNWGLIGIMDVNLIQYFCGENLALARIIYVCIGVSALYFIFRGIQNILEAE